MGELAKLKSMSKAFEKRIFQKPDRGCGRGRPHALNTSFQGPDEDVIAKEYSVPGKMRSPSSLSPTQISTKGSLDESMEIASSDHRV
jgi:hypothetical protein